MPSRWPLPLALAVLLAAPADAADQSVTATPGSEFSPESVTVDVGDTVTWNNGGGFHNVRFDDGSFEQPAEPDPSAWTVERTFDTPGTFGYYCELHGGPGGVGMSGIVAVTDASGQVPPPPEDVEPGLTVRAPERKRLGRVVKRGALEVRPRCENGCELRMKLTVAPRVAKRLGFKRRRTRVGRSGPAVLPPDRAVRIDVELTRKAKRRFKRAERAFKVRLHVRAVNDTRERARRTVRIVP